MVKKRFHFNSSDFTMPMSTFTKYPIFLEILLSRIERLRSDYSINSEIRVFRLIKDKAKAQKELRNKGGVYILWCRDNGFFYVGSAIRFFTNKGRLTDYFMKGRVKSSIAGNSTKVSKKLAECIDKYSISSFVLIIVEEYDYEELIKRNLQLREQLPCGGCYYFLLLIEVY